eukprot:TRINITY_DN1320_c0_g1_i5.p1 TRINITY_DN1320_c0_g1~~TRINITY_DN1320_c0_g1_i5.p1  ORF type:complete len:133 (+),score=41.96 TRINITY_DN1320_c0_g1_i5:42-440(+)
MIRRPPRSTQSRSSAASDVYKRQVSTQSTWGTNQIKMGNCLKSRGKKKDDENLYEGSKDQSLNLSSKPENPKAAVKGNQPKSWEIRKAGLKREDFEFVLRENETLIKPPGSINGQRFVIDSCKVRPILTALT